MVRRIVLACLIASTLPVTQSEAPAQTAPQLIQLNAAQLWQRVEFAVTNVPSASNPFDPDLIRLDAEFTLPFGKVMTVPGFWFQEYQRGLSGGYEYLTANGSPGWRVRLGTRPQQPRRNH